MDRIEIRFKYTENEFVSASRKFIRYTKKTKVDLIIFPIGLVCLIAYMVLTSFGTYSVGLISLYVFTAMLFSFVYYLRPIITFRRIPKFQDEYYLKFDENGIAFKTANIDSKLNWDMYIGFWKSSDFYYLIYGKEMYTIIPKRAFQSADEMMLFESIVTSNAKNITEMKNI